MTDRVWHTDTTRISWQWKTKELLHNVLECWAGGKGKIRGGLNLFYPCVRIDGVCVERRLSEASGGGKKSVPISCQVFSALQILVLQRPHYQPIPLHQPRREQKQKVEQIPP